MWSHLFQSSYIGSWSSKELHTSCVCSCITSTLDKHHNTCQTVYPQFLHSVADTGWGRLAKWITFCQEQDLRTRFLLPWPSRLEHSSFRPPRHYWHRYIHKTNQECTLQSCLPLTRLLLALLDVSYSGALQISRWLTDQEGHPVCKNWVVGCWRCYLSGVRCRLAYGSADATATHCLLLR